MVRGILKGLTASGLAALMAVPLSADIKIKTKRDMMGHSSEDTVYIKGQRERTEMGAMLGMNLNIITILQCDKNRSIQLNPATKTYMITPLDAGENAAGESSEVPAPSPQKGRSAPAPPEQKPEHKKEPTRKGGVVTMNVSSADTGERKDIFGYKARHVKTNMSMEASPDACSKGAFKMENDGWYADLSPGLVCRTHVRPSSPGLMGMGGAQQGGCQDSFRFHTSGFANTGYPLKLTTTFINGGNSFATSVEVTELSKATLEDALFEIPAGYREAKDYSEFMGHMSMGEMIGQISRAATTTENSTAVATSSAKLPAKNPDIARVGVPLIKNDSSQKLPQMRDYLIQQLKNAGLDPAPVEGSSTAQIEADAKAKDCDYILYTDVASVNGGSAGKKVGGILGGMVGMSSGKPGTYDVTVAYKLNKPGKSNPLLESTEESREGAAPAVGVNTALEQIVRATLNYIRKNQ